MAEKLTSNFTLLGKTYVDLRAIVAFEQTSDSRTKIYLDCGHEIVVDVPAHNVRYILETK